MLRVICRILSQPLDHDSSRCGEGERRVRARLGYNLRSRRSGIVTAPHGTHQPGTVLGNAEGSGPEVSGAPTRRRSWRAAPVGPPRRAQPGRPPKSQAKSGHPHARTSRLTMRAPRQWSASSQPLAGQETAPRCRRPGDHVGSHVGVHAYLSCRYRKAAMRLAAGSGLRPRRGPDRRYGHAARPGRLRVWRRRLPAG
jgi:hypothetical protein